MSAPSLADAFQVGVDILNTTVSSKTKKILAQTGDVNGSGQTDADNVEWWQHVGFASRPANPEKGKQAAQALVLRQGGHDAAFASQDLRGLDIYGQLAPGESCVYATGADGTAQARILLKANGSINLFTKAGNDSGGAGMGIFINPDGSISIANPTGAAVLIGDDGAIKIFNGSGGIQVTDGGDIKLGSGGKVVISGGSVTIGGPSALPIAIGPNVVTAISSLQTQLTALSAYVTADAAWAAAVQADPTHAAASSLIAAVGTTASAGAAAVASGATAVSAASAIIPSLRTSSD